MWQVVISRRVVAFVVPLYVAQDLFERKKKKKKKPKSLSIPH